VFQDVYKLVEEGKLSSNNTKALIEELLSSDSLPGDIEKHASESGYIQMSDSSEIESVVQKVIEDNPKPAEDVKNGEMKAIGYLVGQVMKQSQGKANPALAKEIITRLLGV